MLQEKIWSMWWACISAWRTEYLSDPDPIQRRLWREFFKRNLVWKQGWPKSRAQSIRHFAWSFSVKKSVFLRVLIPSLLVDRHPPALHFFRNYDHPTRSNLVESIPTKSGPKVLCRPCDPKGIHPPFLFMERTHRHWIFCIHRSASVESG